MLTGLHCGPIGVRPKLLCSAAPILLFFFFFTSFQAIVASPMDAPSFSYTQRLWQMQDGLPEQVVQAFAQTADRYLWIGTTGGLVRFDGERFLIFDRDNTTAFSDNNVFCLTVARDNALWIGMEGGGLVRYRDGVFHSFSNSDGLTNAFVRVVYEDSKGKIWIGTDNGLFLLSGERLERVDNTEGIPAIAVHAIHEDRRGQVWVGGSKFLQLRGDTAFEYHLGSETSQNRVKSITETQDGTMWVGTVSGLQKMAPKDSAFKTGRREEYLDRHPRGHATPDQDSGQDCEVA